MGEPLVELEFVSEVRRAGESLETPASELGERSRISPVEARDFEES